jgi:hypothetical protein
MTLPIPTEEMEQRVFVHYLELKRLKFSSIPNSTWTTSHRQKAKNTATGLRPGLPDLLVIVNSQVIWIEMKRVKGGVTSASQKAWIEALNAAGTPAYVCAGAEAAIKIIENYINAPKLKKPLALNPEWAAERAARATKLFKTGDIF